MFGVTVRDHVMIAHSFDGEVFGPAQRLHGATYVVDATFRGPDLGPDGILVDIGRAADGAARACWPRSTTATSTTRTSSRAPTPRPRRWPGGSPTGWPTGSPTTEQLTGLVVTLHESHVAWASYERPL